MELIPIRAESQSGYKADEYPISFYWNEIKYEIEEITDRWYQTESSGEFSLADYFKIVDASMKPFILKHDLKNDQWFLCI